MAFCSNRTSVNQICYHSAGSRETLQPPPQSGRNGGNPNKGKPPDKGKPPNIIGKQKKEPYKDALLSTYVNRIVKVEATVGVLTEAKINRWYMHPEKSYKLTHRYNVSVFRLFKGFKRNEVLDLIYGYTLVEPPKFEGMDKDELKTLFDNALPITKPTPTLLPPSLPYYPAKDVCDVPIISSVIGAPTPDAVNVSYVDATLTRRYSYYLRLALHAMHIDCQVIVTNYSIKGKSAHNGYHLFVYGFIQALLICGCSLYIPGFNFRELCRDYIGQELYTSLTNRGYYLQWLQCVYKDLCAYYKSNNAPFDYEALVKSVKGLVDTYILDDVPSDKYMVLGFGFNPYLCSKYDPTKDYCILNKVQYESLKQTVVKPITGEIIFDDQPIGQIHGEMTPFCNIYAVLMGDSTARVYYDFIPREFADVLDKQFVYSVRNSNILLFHPRNDMFTFKTGRQLPLVKGIDDLGSFHDGLGKFTFPEQFCFIDGTTDVAYMASGDYTDHCYQRSVIDAFRAIAAEHMIDTWNRDISIILRNCDCDMPEFYCTDAAQPIVVNNSIYNMPPNAIFGANPDVLPDGVTPAAYIYLFDMTFGAATRLERFLGALCKIPNWQRLYNGNPAGMTLQQIAMAIANQYHIQNVHTPYALYTLHYYVVNISLQYQLDSNGNRIEGTGVWVQNTFKYVYPGRFDDDTHMIRICTVCNLETNQCHAYFLGTEHVELDDYCKIFTLPDEQYHRFLKKFPKLHVPATYVRHQERGFMPHYAQRPYFDILNPRERGPNGMASYNDLVIDDAYRFCRDLETGINIVQVPNDVAIKLQLFYVDSRRQRHYCHYLISSVPFAQKAFQALGNEFANVQFDEFYLRMLLGDHIPFVEKHYVRCDYRHINKQVVNATPICLGHMQRYHGRNRMSKPFKAIWNDWWVYNVKVDDNAVPTLSDTIDKHTMTPIFVDSRVVTSYDLYGAAQRPTQAFYRDIIRVFSNNYAGYMYHHSVYAAPSLMSQTLIYLDLQDGFKRIHVDGNVCGIAQTLCFDKRMKSIPFINAPLTELVSDGNQMKYNMYYYAFPSPSYLMGKSIMCYYNNTCPENITETVCARQLMFRPGVVCHENVYAAFDLFYDHFMTYFEDAHILTAKELLAVHKNGHKYIKCFCSEDAILFLAFSAFIKTEPYPFDFDSKKVKPPRLIMNPGKYVNFFMITYSHMLEDCLRRMPYFAKGKNSRETATDLYRLWSRLRNPCAIGMDFTQFEHFVSSTVLVASMSIFVHLTGMKTTYVRRWIKRLVYMCKKYKLNFLATRISGEFQTSFGNMIIVGAILFYVIYLVKKDHPDSQAYFYSAGDDCMILCNVEEQEWYKEKMALIVRDFGMIVKTEAVYTQFDEIHFCQQYPVEVYWTDENGQEIKTWWMINDLVRVLDKLAVQPRVPKYTKADLNRWACLGCYLEFMFGSLPELRDLIINLKNLAPYRMHGKITPDFRRAFKTSQDWHIIEALGSSHNFKPEYRIVNPQRMYEVCGMVPQVMEYYLQYFKTWSPYQYIDHHVDVEYFADENGNTVFQYGSFPLIECVHKYSDTTLGNPTLRIEDKSYTEITEQWFRKLVTVCGGYCDDCTSN